MEHRVIQLNMYTNLERATTWKSLHPHHALCVDENSQHKLLWTESRKAAKEWHSATLEILCYV